MKDSKIHVLAEEFSKATLDYCKWLEKEKKEYKRADQLARCATSVGANLAEATFAESESDFLHKIKISLKEANEAVYWIELFDSKDMLPKECRKIKRMANNLVFLLAKTVKKVKVN